MSFIIEDHVIIERFFISRFYYVCLKDAATIMTVLVTGMLNLVMLQLHVYSIVHVAMDTAEA